jgi:hypothetical protein
LALERRYCGVAKQRRARRGASSAKKCNKFFGGERWGRDAQILFRTSRLGIRPALPEPRTETRAYDGARRTEAELD